MDKRFLDKVVDMIVSETEIDYGRKVIETPIPLSYLLLRPFSSSYSLPFPLFFFAFFSCFLQDFLDLLHPLWIQRSRNDSLLSISANRYCRDQPQPALRVIGWKCQILRISALVHIE